MKRFAPVIAAALLSGGAAAEAGAAELRGSRASMVRQHEAARMEDYTFLQTPAQVRRYAFMGLLEPVWGNGDYELAKVSFPYARPEVKRFIEELARAYRRATGEPLIVTSLTRPSARQPGNAHDLSVHPAGIAVDLRVPKRAEDRRWLEEALLELEVAGVLDVTRERRPPHYHVAVFPGAYAAHVDRLEAAAVLTRASRGEPAQAALAAPLERASDDVVSEAAGESGRSGLPLAAVALGFLLLIGGKLPSLARRD